MKKIRKQNGFTIIELLVAMSIFAIVLTTTSISFIGSLRAQRAATKLIEANENASITIERISREIRTGTSFAVTDSGDKDQLSFINARGDKVAYYLKTEGGLDRLYERLTLSGRTLSQEFPLTSEGVDIKGLNFQMKELKDNGLDPIVPKITMSLVVGLPEDTQSVSEVETNIQTTISARPLNTLPPEDPAGGSASSTESGENL